MINVDFSYNHQGRTVHCKGTIRSDDIDHIRFSESWSSLAQWSYRRSQDGDGWYRDVRDLKEVGVEPGGFPEIESEFKQMVEDARTELRSCLCRLIIEGENVLQQQ